MSSKPGVSSACTALFVEEGTHGTRAAQEAKLRNSQLRVILIYSSPDSALQKPSMTLREVTRAVLSLVENVSGCPVVVSEDVSLKSLAASRIVRGPNRAENRDSSV